jgi:hypothetical protein
MGAVIEVDWFNTYLLKKVTDADLEIKLNTGEDFVVPRNGFALSPGVAYPGQASVLSFNNYIGQLTSTITTQGSGYTNGEYNFPSSGLTVTTTGNGVGASFSVVVNNNVVQSVTAIVSGKGYAVGDDVTLIGIPGTPGGDLVLTFPNSYGFFQDFSWYVEESRIRGGYIILQLTKVLKLL